MVAATQRYEQVSPAVEISNLPKLVEVINTSLPVEWQGDEYGKVAKAVDYVKPRYAKECVEAIDSLPPGEDPVFYVWLSRQDLMCRPSFVWDLRNGPIPETGSSQTVEHYPIPLAPGRQYFSQFVPQGACEKLVCDGFAHHYYSETRCMETIKKLVPLVGKGWSLEIRKTDGNSPQHRDVIAIFRSHVADQVYFAVTCHGQGKITKMPELLALMGNGVEFFNVMDHDYRRVRPGCRYPNGDVWQYP